MKRYMNEILRLENKLMLADQLKDMSIFGELIADDALLTTPHGRVMRKQELLDKLRLAGESMFTRYERSELRLSESASQIIVNCLIDLENSTQTGLYRLTRVWSQLQGGWKIISGTISVRQDLIG